MELYLIRHAQSQNNARPQEQRVEDPPLTEIGHEQARCLAQRILSLRLDRLITSPFLRTLQTAEHVGSTSNLTPEVWIDLHELGGCVSGPDPEVMVGKPGMNRSEIELQFPTFNVSAEIDGHGWWNSKPYETRALAARRALKLLARTRQEFPSDGRVGYLMHGDFKRLLLAQFHDEPLDVPLNTSITRVSINSNQVRLENYNCVEHLPEHLFTY